MLQSLEDIDLTKIIEIDDELDDLLKEVNTGSSISVFGKLIKSVEERQGWIIYYME